MSSNRTTPEQRQEWIDKVENWRSSNKSAAAWCRENDVDYDKFIYWKCRFFPKNAVKSIGSKFLEFTEEKTNSTGITIEYQGFRIQLSKQLDLSALQSLLAVMRRL